MAKNSGVDGAGSGVGGAQQQLELALFLMSVPRASFQDIVRECEPYNHYTNLDSAAKKIKRDLKDLTKLGLYTRSFLNKNGERIIALDEALTYADTGALDAQAALLAQALTYLLQPLAHDQSFFSAFQLRTALAKLSGKAGNAASFTASVKGFSYSRSDMRLIDSIHKRCELRIDYIDAEGSLSQRIVQPYGFYVLNGHFYLVAKTRSVMRNGEAEPEDDDYIKRYRSDRIRKCRELNSHYEIPSDFDIDDWEVLPFMLGDSVGEVTFVCADEAQAAAVASDCKTDAVEQIGNELRFAKCASYTAAARWAIAQELCPRWGTPVAEKYLKLLEGAAKGVKTDGTSAGTQMKVRRSKESGRSRTKANTEKLLALVSLFNAPGDSYTTKQIARQLESPEAEVEELLSSLSTTSLQEGYFPLRYVEESDVWTFDEYSSYRIQRLRLSVREAEAVDEALARLTNSAEALPGFEGLRAAFWPVKEDDEAADGSEEAEGTESAVDNSQDSAPSRHDFSNETMGVLTELFKAMSQRRTCEFSYCGRNDEKLVERRALPLSSFSKDGQQYINAFDFDRKGLRQFRIDRMSDVRQRELTTDEGALLNTWDTTGESEWLHNARTVELYFTNDMQMSFFNWEGMEVAEQLKDGRIKALVPDLGSTWLPRHIAAFGGEITTSDSDLAERVKSYAQALLERI